MTPTFTHDVFLSHSSKDKAVVRGIAERLKENGLRVWLDELEIRPGDSIPAKIEEGLEHSRVLVLCMSANAFGSDWAQLEAGTFRFRDPLNKERRFLPLRLDDTPIKGSLAQFAYINWLPEPHKQEYAKLLETCRNAEREAELVDEVSANTVQHIAGLASARRSEWKRLRADFESEARKYHDAKMSVFYVTKAGLTTQDTFPQPSHAISLWQYFGASHAVEAIGQLRETKLKKFGISGAEVSAFGLVLGAQTSLFCKMAIRSGSLLPDEVSHIIVRDIAEKHAGVLGPGKPIFVTNNNALEKWLNLMLVSTKSSHPERLKGGTLAVDSFAASLTVFDYFQIG